MTLILGVANGTHDGSACLFDDYRLIAAVPEERLTRSKSAGGDLPHQAINEVCAIAGVARHEIDVVAIMRGMLPIRYFRKTYPLGIEATTRRLRDQRRAGEAQPRLAVETVMWRFKTFDVDEILKLDYFRREQGFRADAEIFFYDHHFAHAIQPLFHRPDWDEALLYTVDGGGDRLRATAHHFKDGRIRTLFGDYGDFMSRTPVELSVASLYGLATAQAGFKMLRHEGKLTGLSARGAPVALDALKSAFEIQDDGAIRTRLRETRQGRKFIKETLGPLSREDLSASIQRFAEDMTVEAVRRMLRTTGARRVGLCGGLFANVLLNQKLLEETEAEEVFVYPSMSDQGLSVGGALHYLLKRDGIEAWLANRWPIGTLYLGRDYDGMIDQTLGREFAAAEGAPAAAAVDAIEAGQAVAIYKGRMEFGPRALGARSVLADPRSATINDSLNARMERSEFMPFAPYVAAEDADQVFELPAGARAAARFMTITCAVRPEWRERLKAVTHVDGTARPQLITREENPLYYDVLAEFKRRTGAPALVNTSFNAHEEPIINSPAECARALRDDRVDAVLTDHALWRPPGPAARA